MDSIIQAVISVLVLMFSVVVHECAHGLAAGYFGDPTARLAGRLTLNPVKHIDPVGTLVVPFVMSMIGGVVVGWAKPVPVNGANLRNPRDHFPLVSLAGPVANMLLALLCAIVLGFYVGLAGADVANDVMRGNNSALSFFFLLLHRGIFLNVLLALFNLIPLPPLDGGWILARFLGPTGRMWLERIRPYGFFILIALLYLGFGQVLGRGVHQVSNVGYHLAERLANMLL